MKTSLQLLKIRYVDKTRQYCQTNHCKQCSIKVIEMNIRESMDELRQAAKRLGLPITDSRVCLEVMKARESKQVKSKK